VEEAMQKNREKTEKIEKKVVGKRDQFSGLFWGISLIYIGVLLMLVEFDFLYGDEWFPYFVFGFGVLMVGDFLLRQFFSSLRSASVAKLIFGILFIILSANHLFYLYEWWPLLLVLIGGIMVWSSFRKREGKVNFGNS
jgi:fatty acid desaturase